MKRNRIYRTSCLLAGYMLLSAAALAGEGNPPVFRKGDRLCVELTLGTGETELSANEQLIVTPVITDGKNRMALAPVVFTGRIRQKVDERRERLYGTPALPEGAADNIVLRNRKQASEETLFYVGDVPYEPWMAGGDLVLQRDLTGCAGHSASLSPLLLARIPAPVRPQLTLLVPAEEPVKRRSEQITAVVHFPQGRPVLLRGFADNGRQLQRIDSLTARLQENDGLTIEKIYLKGYASPEDTYAFNTKLSANRVASIRNYLHERFAIPESDFTTATVPEDWDSLRRWIVVSDLPVRDEVLAVIDEVSDPDARDAAIWKIDNGKTYLRLLHEVYPQLRRVDYRVEYLLPAFTTEQSRRLIESGPGQLSLAEMCRLAASYPEDSPERASVCAVASAYYPDDPCACNNSAMLALRQGDTQTARHYLSRCADDPRSLNNLGVLCLMEGDREKARHCFTLAADRGSADAAYNLAHFDELSYEDFGQRSSENLL